MSCYIIIYNKTNADTEPGQAFAKGGTKVRSNEGTTHGFCCNGSIGCRLTPLDWFSDQEMWNTKFCFYICR